MSYQFNFRIEDIPTEMQSLLRQYPRDLWHLHPGFKDKTRHWLGAHLMFRQLSASVRKDAENYLGSNQDAQSYAGHLSYRGNALIGNLHGHHGWEDQSYFPELSAADPQFDAGLEILKNDHKDLDVVLDSFIETANRAIKLIHLDENQARDEVGKLHRLAETIEVFLERHLSDEEELAVPIILHYRLRG